MRGPSVDAGVQVAAEGAVCKPPRSTYPSLLVLIEIDPLVSDSIGTGTKHIKERVSRSRRGTIRGSNSGGGAARREEEEEEHQVLEALLFFLAV